MYNQLNEEIERTPCTVKTLLVLSFVSTLLLVILFTAALVSLSDFGTLLTDGAQTLQDMQRILPDAERSLRILEKLCAKQPSLC